MIYNNNKKFGVTVLWQVGFGKKPPEKSKSTPKADQAVTAQDNILASRSIQALKTLQARHSEASQLLGDLRLIKAIEVSDFEEMVEKLAELVGSNTENVTISQLQKLATDRSKMAKIKTTVDNEIRILEQSLIKIKTDFQSVYTASASIPMSDENQMSLDRLKSSM